jgi:hypothetical protein
MTRRSQEGKAFFRRLLCFRAYSYTAFSGQRRRSWNSSWLSICAALAETGVTSGD